MVTVISKWAQPKPGHEDAYFEAMLDRHNASMAMLDLGVLGRLFQFRRYNRLLRDWEEAVDRMKEHGQDIVTNAR